MEDLKEDLDMYIVHHFPYSAKYVFLKDFGIVYEILSTVTVLCLSNVTVATGFKSL